MNRKKSVKIQKKKCNGEGKKMCKTYQKLKI